MEGKGRARPRQATKKEKGGVERDKRRRRVSGGAFHQRSISKREAAATKGEYGLHRGEIGGWVAYL